MNLAIVASPESWYFKDLARAAACRHELSPIAFSRLASEVGGNGTSVTCGDAGLDRFDAVLVRTMPPGSLEQVVFRMDVLGRLEAAGHLIINPARALETAVDKYLALAKLQAAGLEVPRTRTCQTIDEAMQAFSDFGRDVVFKPLFGSEGRGITRLCDEALAWRAFKMLEALGAVLYVQEFISHSGCDLRLLVVGRRVLGMRRSNAGDWRTNISRGAQGEPLQLTEELVELALRAVDAVGAPLAGVDLLPSHDGRQYAIEVNAVPGWRALARVLDLDVAAIVLDFVESLVERRYSA